MLPDIMIILCDEWHMGSCKFELDVFESKLLSEFHIIY